VRFLRAAVGQVVGLFVGDWLQSAVVVVIIALGYYAVRQLGTAAIVVLVVLLAAQLVWFARADAIRRSPRQSRS
jgi:hypothetical protein